jgi:hypothetical protein
MSRIDDLDLRHTHKAAATVKTNESIGSNGVATVGGFVISDERLPKLTGQAKYRTFMELLHDHTMVASAVRLFLNLLAKAQWQVTPAADMPEGQSSDKAKQIAETVEQIMNGHKTTWRRIVRRSAMYKFYGFSLQEWILGKREDGVIGMYDVSNRPQSTIVRWDIDDAGDVVGVWQQLPDMKEVYLPRDRLIYMVDDSLTDGPEGVGLLRHVVRAGWRLKAFEQLEEVGYETDLRGVPIGYGPWEEIKQGVKNGSLTAAQANSARKPLLDFVKGHLRNKEMGLLLDSSVYTGAGDSQTPSGTRKWAAETVRGEGMSFDAMAKAIGRLNAEIARALGAEHILLGSDGSGSLALGKSKAGTFYLTVTSTQYELVEGLESDWLAPVCIANGWPQELWPSLAVEEVRDEDIEEITTALERLSRAGAMLTRDDPAVGEVLSMLGLSPLAEDADLQLGGNEPDPDKAMEVDEATANATADATTKRLLFRRLIKSVKRGFQKTH